MRFKPASAISRHLREQRRVVLQHEPGLRCGKALEQSLLLAAGGRNGKDVFHSVWQVFRQAALGHIAGRALL